MKANEKKENERLKLQTKLDSEKTSKARNKLGQFSTPTELARDILEYAKKLIPNEDAIRFLDPAIGTGSFYSALLNVFPSDRLEEAVGYEIDEHYAGPAIDFWKDTNLKILTGDFTKQKPQKRFNLLICNPPYVRHHHLLGSEKTLLQNSSLLVSGAKIGGLSGLYSYFIALSHGWLASGAISAWLVPSEFMDVNYGGPIKEYLLNKVTLLRVHRFDPTDVQFTDALVSSAVVVFKNEPCASDHSVEFTFGGSLKEPKVRKNISTSILRNEKKWTRFPSLDQRSNDVVPKISDYFLIKRGIATGNNNFFILSEKEIKELELPKKYFKPILPGPRQLKTNKIESDSLGNPLIEEKLFLLDCNLSEEEIKAESIKLWEYLAAGKAQGVNKGYLCSHRNPWYSQEKRLPAPFICTYLGRSDKLDGQPFRFIINKSQATITNVYLALYPKSDLLRAVQEKPNAMEFLWGFLNRITSEQLLGEGRVYGGGLHKLEPKELGNVPVPEIADFLSSYANIYEEAAE